MHASAPGENSKNLGCNPDTPLSFALALMAMLPLCTQEELVEHDLEPNEVVFGALMNACAQSGQVRYLSVNMPYHPLT